jgi:hypothetical protein
MNDSHQHINRDPDNNNALKIHRPYWKHAHRDWRIWAAVVIMVGGMVIYIMTDDFSMRFLNRPPVTLGK